MLLACELIITGFAENMSNANCLSRSCIGSLSDPNIHEVQKQKSSYNIVLYFFKYIFPKLIMKKWFQITTGIMYFFYLSISVYGILNFKDGLREEHLIRDDSFLVPYYNAERSYFKNYSSRIQVVSISKLT